MRIFGFNITRPKRSNDIDSLGTYLAESERTIIPQSIVNGISALSGAPDKRYTAEPSKISKKRRVPASVTVDEVMPDNAGGRVTVETQEVFGSYALYNSISSKKRRNDYFALGRSFDLDTVAHLAYDDLVELLADLSPEISKALWDYVLLCNPGFTCKAFTPNTENPHEQGQAYIDDVILAALSRYNGTDGTFFDRLCKMTFFRGSFLLELVIDENGRDFVDIASPDTRTLEFRRRLDDKRGQTWIFGQRINGQFVDLSGIDNIRYVPIQPNPDSIEGTPLCTSAIFLAIFMMAVLRDVKRVIQNQGYMRLDVEIDFEKMRETMPEEIQGDSTKMKIWAQDLVNQVTVAYNQLKPESTYIHPSTIKVNRPVGTTSGDSIQSIDAMFKALDRMIVRALKTMPILLGTNQSRSETQANREWEIYAKGIESIQHPIESAFEDLVQRALIAQGILADVQFRFAQFRGAEAARDEQVKLLKLEWARTAYDNGYISQDEAASYGAEKEVADAEEPRNAFPPPSAFNAFAGGINGGSHDPGSDRAKRIEMLLRSIITQTRQPSDDNVEDANNFWEEYAPEDAKELIDADLIEQEGVEQ